MNNKKYVHSQYYIDEYSVVHYLAGIASYIFIGNIYKAVVLHILFEIMENQKWFSNIFQSKKYEYYGDSYKNSLFDTISFTLGFYTIKIINV